MLTSTVIIITFVDSKFVQPIAAKHNRTVLLVAFEIRIIAILSERMAS